MCHAAADTSKARANSIADALHVSSNDQAALDRSAEPAIHTAACRRQVKPNATGTKKATEQVVGVSSVLGVID